MKQHKLGWIGIGRMGYAMAQRLAEGGCDIAVLNIHEKIAEVAAAFEIVFWPCVMDTKYADVEALPDGSGLDFLEGLWDKVIAGDQGGDWALANYAYLTGSADAVRRGSITYSRVPLLMPFSRW